MTDTPLTETEKDVVTAINRLVRVVEEQWADHTGDYDFFADHLDLHNRARKIVAIVKASNDPEVQA